MKKTISINLNRQVFNLDTDAYSKLDAYLSDIKKHFDQNDSSEIIDDIESRIAEKFTEILGKAKKAIQIEDVDQVVADIGSVSDIAGDDTDNETEKTDKNSSSRKKLFRDTDSKIIAGVASGLAWYFGIRSLFIRLIFLVLLFNRNTSCLSLLTYLACWLIIPKAKNNFEKLEMQGRPATLDELQNISEQTDSTSSLEKKTQNFFQKIFSVFFKLIKFCFKWSLKLTGFFCFLINIILIVGLVVGFVLLYFNQFFPYVDLTFLKSIGSPALEIGFISLGLSFLMPLIFCLDLSDDLMRLKWNTSFKKVLLMILVWIISLVTFATTAKITYPQYQPQLTAFVDHFKYFTAIDETNSQTINIKNIPSIDISNVRQVKLVQSNENILIITGNQHQIDELNTKISSEKIYIQGKSATWSGCDDCLGYVSSVRVEIHSPNLNNIKLNNTDAEIQTQSGNYQINLVKKTGLKITGNLNTISLTAGPDTVTNLLDTNVGQIEAHLTKSTLKTAAKIIKIKGDSQSVLIYKNQPQIIPQSGDQSQKQKYILSQDHEKLVKTLEETIITLDGSKKTLKDLNWSSNFEIQSDSDFYHIYTFIKPQNTTNVYVLWLVEKDGVVTLNKSFKITGWEDVHYLNLVNDKFIQINGQVYGPELKEETKEIYIDKIKNKLEIYLPKDSE
ncbi:MAG: PspC domain-containing protein [Candidatus Shapirobacteria bacterium]|nr:PspC domain-containing protein [Candidatus Shapirobacteria bacterium]